MGPRIIDNDKDEITASIDGKELRGWSYANNAERRQKMLQAREYVEGWCDGRLEAAEWCAFERAKLGAVDGYDYHSGEEYALRRAQITLEG